MDNLQKQNNNKKQNVSETTVNIKDTFDGVTGLSFIDCLDLYELRVMKKFAHDVKYRKAYDMRLNYLTEEYALKRTNELLKRRRHLCNLKHEELMLRKGNKAGTGPHIFAESRQVGDMDMSSSGISHTHENLVDRTGEVEQLVDAGKSLHETEDGGKTVHTLDEFFSRPVSIYDDTISTLEEKMIVLKVWNEWSLNPAVRAKLSNYAFFKGNLHIKIAVSGTPFHYGRLLSSYQPFAKYNDNLNSYNTLYASATPGANATAPAFKCYLSQARGVGYIDFKENEPVLMDIPFVSYRERFRLYNTSPNVITDSTSLYDFEEAGDLYISTLNPLRIANDDHDTHASINVYAWMTDVELGCITGTNIDITAESKAVDEYADSGPISSAASAVMKVGETLSSVPIIGEFAKATSTLARGVRNVALFFGFSKPAVLENVTFVKNAPFHNGMTLAGHETTLKLTMDPKQELSIDPTLGGVSGEDEMSIAAITSRESFLTTFNWDSSQAAMTSVIWKAFVTPSYMTGIQVLPAPVSNLTQPTPLAFAAGPFEYWRGSITYRMEFVCSKFHRGKVLIRYEPNTPMSVLIASSPAQLNQQNSIILDLQESQEITFSVGWAQPRSWAKIPESYLEGIVKPAANLGDAGISTNLSFFNNNELNGYLEVRPLNELVQPTALSFVSVNVYVSSDDMEFMVPTSKNMPDLRYITSESREINDIGFINPRDGHTEKIHLDHFGERVVSFRALMKRYTTYTILTATLADSADAGTGYWQVATKLYPTPRAPVGQQRTDDKNVHTHLFEYMRYAYLGMRGGMRKRIVPLYSKDTLLVKEYVRTGLGPAESPAVPAALDRIPIRSQAEALGFVAYGELSGSVIHHINTNGGIEFEHPYYDFDLFRFAFNKQEGLSISTDTDYGVNTKYNSRTYTKIQTQSATDGDFGLTVDMATAEDFTFLRFQGAPFFTSSPLT